MGCVGALGTRAEPPAACGEDCGGAGSERLQRLRLLPGDGAAEMNYYGN